MRQSNVELLRIIAMLCVVMVHLDGASLSLPAIEGNFDALNTRNLWKLSAESVTIIGVNCFTLISGYFGIRASVRGFLRLTFMCLFYSIGINSIYQLWGCFHGITFNWGEWGLSWLVYSHTDLWYVPAYLGLYLLSPLINTTTDGLSNPKYAAFVGALTIYNIWCGWWWEGSFNPTGYTVMQLILMYLIGGGVRRFREQISGKSKELLVGGTATYVICTAVTLLASLYLPTSKAFAYNSPAVIAASTGVLVAFTSFELRSRVINHIALSAFAVYLIHKNPIVWVQDLKPLARSMWKSSDCIEYTLFMIVCAIAIYLGCTLIDSIRIWAQKILLDKIRIRSRQ